MEATARVREKAHCVARWLSTHVSQLSLLFMLLLFFRSSTLTGWDQTFYWAQLTSAWVDGDLVLQNDILESRNAEEVKQALMAPGDGGALSNTFPIGPAWMQGWYAGPAAWVAEQGKGWRYGNALLAAAAVGAMFWSCVCWFGGERLCRRFHLRARHHAPVLLMGFFGTPLWFYALDEYSMAHNLSAVCFVALALCWLWWLRSCQWLAAVGFGVAAGAATLVRWQDGATVAVIVLAAFPFFVRSREKLWLAMLQLAAATGIASFMLLLQLAVWKIFFGSWIVMPQGSGYMRWGEPQLGHFLFSGYHGMLIWHPLWVVAVVGLCVGFMRCRGAERAFFAGGIAAILLSICINAVVEDWWGGASFGARRMVSLFPFFLCGLAVLLRSVRIPRWVIWAVAILVVAHGYLLGVAYLRGADDLKVLAFDERSTGAPDHRDVTQFQDRGEAWERIWRGSGEIMKSPERLVHRGRPRDFQRLLTVVFALTLVLAVRWFWIRGARRRTWQWLLVALILAYSAVAVLFILLMPSNREANEGWIRGYQEQFNSR